MARPDLKKYIPHLTDAERALYEDEKNKAKWCHKRWKVHYYAAEELLRQARARARQQIEHA